MNFKAQTTPEHDFSLDLDSKRRSEFKDKRIFAIDSAVEYRDYTNSIIIINNNQTFFFKKNNN